MTKVKIGINGFGRIGRIAFRIASERSNVEVVGINDLLDVEHLAYLLKYDSVHGQFKGSIDVKNGNLVVNGKEIRISSERNPEDLKWDAVGADVVIANGGEVKTIPLVEGFSTSNIVNKIKKNFPNNPIICFPKGINKNINNFIKEVKPHGISIDYDINLKKLNLNNF